MFKICPSYQAEQNIDFILWSGNKPVLLQHKIRWQCWELHSSPAHNRGLAFISTKYSDHFVAFSSQRFSRTKQRFDSIRFHIFRIIKGSTVNHTRAFNLVFGVYFVLQRAQCNCSHKQSLLYHLRKRWKTKTTEKYTRTDVGFVESCWIFKTHFGPPSQQPIQIECENQTEFRNVSNFTFVLSCFTHNNIRRQKHTGNSENIEENQQMRVSNARPYETEKNWQISYLNLCEKQWIKKKVCAVRQTNGNKNKGENVSLKIGKQVMVDVRMCIS